MGEEGEKTTGAGTKKGARKADLGKGWKVAALVGGLVAVVVGGILFVGAAAGWFAGSEKVVLSSEYYCTSSATEEECPGELMSLSVPEYEGLIADKKSFILFVDQGGCYTAATLKGFLKNYLNEAGARAYTMMFSEMKETSLYPDAVKYYPSVVIVSEGRVVAALHADAEEDADAYNKEEAFLEWMRGWVR